jgi:hypothetical protein
VLHDAVGGFPALATPNGIDAIELRSTSADRRDEASASSRRWTATRLRTRAS